MPIRLSPKETKIMSDNWISMEENIDMTEFERVASVNKELDQDAFLKAWYAFQNTPIDLVADSDDEQCRCLNNAILAYLHARPAQERVAHLAARDNLREAWSALVMIRETVETLAPIGSVKAAAHLDGPTFVHEAEALGAAILALAKSTPESSK